MSGVQVAAAEAVHDARPRVVVIDPIDARAVTRLEAACRVDCPIGRDPVSLASTLVDADGAIVRTTPLPREVLASAGRLRVIAKHGVGVDNIDVGYATSAGIVVSRATGSNAAAVAEFAVTSILLLCKPILAGARWLATTSPSPPLVAAVGAAGLIGSELASQTVGIVGWGSIGRRVGAALTALGVTVIAYDPCLPTDATTVKDGVSFVCGLTQLLKVADVVTIHVPLNEQTRHLIGAAEMALMPRGAALVNTARGGVVDEQALAAAVRSGHLRGAVVDVFEREPPARDAALMHVDAIICTPHIAGSTLETLTRMADASVTAVLDVLAGAQPQDVANPEVLASLNLAPRAADERDRDVGLAALRR